MHLVAHALLVAALLLPAAAASAQSLTFGQLTGSVLDARGQPVPGVEVRALERASGATRWVSASIDGQFRFGVLPAGRYSVTAEALGYRPVIVTDVLVAAGHSASIAIVLRPAAPPVTTIDTLRAPNGIASGQAWTFDRGYADLVGTRRTLGDVALLSSSSDQNGVEGLPWRFTETMVDGARSSTFGSPAGDGAEGAGLAFPLRSMSSARAGGLGFDVEVGGSGIGLSALSLRGGSAAELRGGIEGGSANYGGSVLAAGALHGDTAQAVFGADYQRSEVTRPSLFGPDAALAAAFVGAAQGFSGTDIAAHAGESTRLEERIGAYGRFDFQPGDRVAVNLRASANRFVSSGFAEPFGVQSRLGSDYNATQGQASLNVFAQITRRFSQEIRVSADIARAESPVPTLAMTTFSGAGVSIGGAAFEPFDEARTVPRGAAILHGRFGSHRMKAGVALASHQVDSRRARDVAGEFRFGDAADLAGGVGAWRAVEQGLPAGQFSISEQAVFVQDMWSPADGLSLSMGIRWEGVRLPTGEIEQNAQWLALSGIDNTDHESSYSGFSPRIGVRWELGRQREWAIEGGGGIFQDIPDSRDMAEVLGRDRSAAVRYGTGALGAWPMAPAEGDAPFVGNTISILGPEYQGPRTKRLALGISRQAGPWKVFTMGVVRHTDFLSRRRDLNLPSTPTGVDQYGRPLMGVLEQHGSLLAVAPASNRRFAEFDAVHALESTGYSTYWGMTAGFERVQPEGISLSVGYTFSRAEDNAPGLGTYSTLAPFPGEAGGLDWAEGTSDFDVPHRLITAAEWTAGPTAPLRLGVVHRLQSGAPFTAGVRDGVDANGDGSYRNDPAYVDAALAGMDALLEENSCLRAAQGLFTERNSCRGAMTHRLDLRAAFRIAQLTAGRLELVVDALDVLATARGRFDNALLLVDRTGTLSRDALTGVTTVPYVVNPDFGKVIADRSPSALWRVGLRIVP